GGERLAEAGDGAVDVAAAGEQRAEVVARLGKIGLQGERPLERGASAGGVAAADEQCAEAVERRRGGVLLRSALKRGGRGGVQALIEQLSSVWQIVPHRGR